MARKSLAEMLGNDVDEVQTPVEPAPAPKPQTKRPAPAAGKQPKVGFYQDPADTERMRGAYRHTQVQEGDRSLSDFISKAVMAEVARRETKYNGGAAFPAIGAGELPQGRPMGE